MLRFRDLGVFVFEFWVLRFRDRVLRFRDRVLRSRVFGASFSRSGCFVFEFWVLRASVFVFECFVFETTDPPHITSPICGPPSPCKQSLRIQLLDKSRTRLHLTNYASWIHRREVSNNANSVFKRRFRHRC